MKARFNNFVPSLILAFLFALCASSSVAQCVATDASILHARYSEGDSKVFVSLSSRVNLSDLHDTGQASQWNLVDFSTSPSGNVPILNVRPDALLGTETTSLTLVLNGPLDVSHTYILAAPSLTFLGCKPKDDALPQAVLEKKKLPAPGTRGQQPAPQQGPNYFPMGKAEDRNDSNVYLAGTIEGARGGKAVFSSDIKIEIPYEISGRKPTSALDLSKKQTIVDVSPYFNLKASSAKDGNPDSMNFGAKFGLQFNVSNTGALRYLLWNPGGGFESDRRFKNINVITSQQLTFGIPGNKHTFKRRIRVLPFIGYELGRNLTSPVKQAEGHAVSRGLVGSTFYLNFYRSEDSGFSFQVDYVRRFLLRRETSFTEDDDKKLIPVSIGKGPRDYLKASAEYDFSKFTGLTLSYEYGKLPPNFELVNHKYALGLVFKFKTKFGSE